ncbi:MAG TPA: hypothetical protein PLZ93_10625 [Nocardioides sp.]|uniref:hypothetical protein n=1 Tax=uncultured Nocardioides sp. TaxID=198441 RepID=UPI000EDA5025|nr:hypothetical protein [uncultured Nocardioides sp.]HCB03752.1 hypothetical protein [Nocardioides sp.]HRD63161.1 hypothetical protein [Nocardioides sp.]HRI96060.1 hypothetical protein [Nocardioides sp.]HRK45675.1 hypothetical protein [Nocardioides sp.]
MLEADAAEARGDAQEALDVITRHESGHDGRPFWRPWRVEALVQLATPNLTLPRWVTSRWVLNQALQSLDRMSRPTVARAHELAVELRGGVDALPGVDEIDAMCRVMDRDWAYRQLFLYDFGGLQAFMRNGASPDLLLGADSLDQWARTPMGGFRLVDVQPQHITWHDLGANESVVTDNIGSATLVEIGRYAIGRLVPVEHGRMFETPPLPVPAEVAIAVAADPAGWLTPLRDALRTVEDTSQVMQIGHEDCLVTDVPRGAWQASVADHLPARLDLEKLADQIARAVLDAASSAFDHPRHTDAQDLWPCLAAALLSPAVPLGLARVARSDDAQLLQRLAERLTAGAADLCLALARELREAA